MEQAINMLNTGRIDRLKIPKVVHFIFEPVYVTELPESWKINRDKFINLHPEYIVYDWDFEKIEHFIATNYSEYDDKYRSINLLPIQRLDIARYFILYHFGGMYIDYDIQWYTKMPLKLHTYNCVLLKEKNFVSLHQVTNALIMCEPKSNLMKEMINNIQYDIIITSGDFKGVLNTTGPGKLSKVLYKYLNKYCCSKLDTWVDSIPLTLKQDDQQILILPTCYAQSTKSFIHQYDCSWSSKNKSDTYGYL